MTLIAALESNQGLVLASDSRGTIGDPAGLVAINDGIQKLFQINNLSGILVSGMNELGARLIDEIKGAVTGDDDVDTVAERVRQISTQRLEGWFPGFLAKSPQQKVEMQVNVVFLIAGYKRDGGIPFQPRIFSLPSVFNFMPFLHTTGYALAGVPQYATYLLHRIYDRTLPIVRVSEIAAFIITETASQEPKVGGPIQMCRITPNACIQLQANDLDAILETNRARSDELKHFFAQVVQ